MLEACIPSYTRMDYFRTALTSPQPSYFDRSAGSVIYKAKTLSSVCLHCSHGRRFSSMDLPSYVDGSSR